MEILKNKNISDKKLELKNLGITDLEKRSIENIMGMAIGDAMGSTYKFRDVNYETIDLKDMEREK